MILALDIDDAGARVGAVGKDASRWFRTDARNPFIVLDQALKKAPRPSVIVVTQTEPGSGRKATWSVIRSGIAVGNALSFALGLPITDAKVTGVETDEELASLARRAVVQAKKGLIVPRYSGEPNITTPRFSVIPGAVPGPSSRSKGKG